MTGASSSRETFDYPGRAEPRRQPEPVVVDVGDNHVASADVAGDGGSHCPDRSGAGDEHVLADEVVAQRGVGRVAEWVENCSEIVVDVVGHHEYVLGRQHEVLRERPRSSDTDADVVAAERPPAGTTVAAVPAGDVTLAGDALTDREAADVAADLGNIAHELVPDDHRDRDRSLGPGVPAPDVQVGSTDRILADPDEHVLRARRRLLDILGPQARLGLRLDQRPHDTRPISRPTRLNASIAWSMSASEWAADIWVRMRAAPNGTTGKEKAITYTPSVNS